MLIVGLGNPGAQYDGTRHNIGFAVLDRFATRHGLSIDRPQKNALTGEFREGGRRIILCKPQTYMNLSGEAVAPLARFYKIAPAEVLVVSDEFQVEFGRLLLHTEGGDGGHNGVKSLIAHLGTKAFPRLRLGVGPLPSLWDPADFVLSRFSQEEQPGVIEIVTRAAEALDLVLNVGVERAMNSVNARKKATAGPLRPNA